MLELACPESCHYLTDARSEVAERERQLRDREREASGRFDEGFNDLIASIRIVVQGAIIAAQRDTESPNTRDLTDAEVLAALESSAKTVKTEASGIIYEHASSSPRVDKVSRRINEMLNKLMGEVPAADRVSRSQIQRALTSLSEDLQAHLNRPTHDRDSRSFLRFTALYFPWPEAETKPLIIAP